MKTQASQLEETHKGTISRLPATPSLPLCFSLSPDFQYGALTAGSSVPWLASFSTVVLSRHSRYKTIYSKNSVLTGL
ncbi:hypothetical protein OUZ56_032172 [Daphnia magna]|uniref:Uncharacterized protein n=1 Tax=Daphnia magna TaxID=35525 RepID=A0ABQ9ZWG5_9CRUS|nr:hypothetical protein OUZ56_032172 [Daphnia magna]